MGSFLLQARVVFKAQCFRGASAQRLDRVFVLTAECQARVCSMLIIITTALLGAIAVVLYMWKVALEEKAAKKLQPAAAAAPAAAHGTSGGSA
jgi:hypothetical protein